MYQIKPNDDTIAAIATPLGAGGIGIVRISGPRAFEAADKIVRLKSGKMPSAMKGFTAAYGQVVDAGGRGVDEVLVTVMRSPLSYTTQDVVELSVHGSVVTLTRVLDRVLAQGARPAQPGEFTKRAFLNGRIDLAQAEAVLDIINARTAEFARISQHQLQGDLSRETQAIREELMGVYTHLEALLNFPEDDLQPDERGRLIQRLDQASARITRLLSSAPRGRILKDGARVVLCGKPNAGKSSLLNRLLSEDRAIVTDLAGTTRDLVEGMAVLGGIPVAFVDTAGILKPRDAIEQEALKRSHLAIDSADLVLLVLDASRPLDDADRQLMAKLEGRKMIAVLNKCDLPVLIEHVAMPGVSPIRICALTGGGLEDLHAALLAALQEGLEPQASVLVVTNARHVQALRQAADLTAQAIDLLNHDLSLEIVSLNIKDAVNACDALTGRNIDADLIEGIFASFCIGK